MTSNETHEVLVDRFKDLSGREKQILGLAAAGLLDKNIAAELKISLNTLRTYWTRIRKKCGNVSRPALTAAYVREEFAHPVSSVELASTNASLDHAVDAVDADGLRHAAVYYATALHRVQDMLRRADRAVRVLATYPESMLTANTSHDMIDTVCRILVEEGGYNMAWVGFPLNDDCQSIPVAGSFGCPQEFLSELHVSWGENEFGFGVAGRTFRSGETVVSQDIDVDPKMEPWRELAMKSGYRSAIGLPLKRGAKTYGILCAYASEPESFDDTEKSVLEAIIGDLAIRLSPFQHSHVDEEAPVSSGNTGETMPFKSLA